MAELLKFNTIVGAKHLSIILGIGERCIQQLCDVGVLEKEGRGKFDIAKCVQAFISYQLDEKNNTGEESAYEQEKTKSTRAKRMIEEKNCRLWQVNPLLSLVIGFIKRYFAFTLSAYIMYYDIMNICSD